MFIVVDEKGNYLNRFTVREFPTNLTFTADMVKGYTLNNSRKMWGLYDNKRKCFVDIHTEGKPHIGFYKKSISQEVANGWNDFQNCESLGIFADTFRKITFFNV